MRASRLFARVFAALLSVALIGLAPAQAAAPTADPLATTVTGACFGGPGGLSLTVHAPAADGTYQVEVTARRLVDGSRWVVRLDEEATGSERRFRRVAVEGGWTVTTQFPSPAPGDGDEVLFRVLANEGGASRYGCYLLNSPASPVGGLSVCNNAADSGEIILLARELDDGATAVRSLILGVPSGSRWHLTLTATGAASRQVVEFDDRAGKRGVVRSRVVITGVMDPRLQVVATSGDEGYCFIGLNPANVARDAPMRPSALAKAVRS